MANTEGNSGGSLVTNPVECAQRDGPLCHRAICRRYPGCSHVHLINIGRQPLFYAPVPALEARCDSLPPIIYGA